MKHILTIETGLSILFCCCQCILTNIYAFNLDDAEASENSSTSGTGRLIRSSFPNQGYLEKPGKDYPVLARIPRTSFTCLNLETGYYADLETRCQVFHICEDGKKMSFLCPNGTIFQQSDLICDWWFKVNCTVSPLLYEESSEQLREASLRRKLARRTPLKNNIYKTAFRQKESVTNKYTQASRRSFEVENTSSSSLNSYPTTEFISTRRRLSTPQVQDQKPSTDKTIRSRVNSRRLYKNIRNHTPQHSQPLNKPKENDEEKSSPLTSSSKNFNGKVRIKISNTIQTKKINEFNQPSTNPSINEKTYRDENNFVNIVVNSKPKVLKSNKSNRPTSKSNSCQHCKNNGNYKSHISTKIGIQEEPKPLEESQITQESSSSFNSPSNIHPNHRTTYNEIKEPNYFDNKYSTRIIPVTSQYLTTQSFNKGKTFIGSSVGKSIPRKDSKNGENNLSNSQNKSTSSEDYFEQEQRKQNNTDTANKFRKYNKSHMITNVTSPFSVAEINSSLFNTQLNKHDNTELITEKDLDDTSNGFVRFGTGMEQNFSAKSTVNYLPESNATSKLETHDMSTSSTEGTLNSSEDNSLDSPLTRTLFSSKPPRPFGKISREPPTSVSKPNDITKSHEPSLFYPFFRISTAMPFTLHREKEEQINPILTYRPEPVTESIILEESQSIAHNKKNKSKEISRSGLVVPPSVSPRIIHSLAAYYENSMSKLNQNEKSHPSKHNDTMITVLEDRLKSLFSNMTRDGYEKLFMENGFMEDIKATNSSKITNQQDDAEDANDSEDVRKLAKVFSHALSQYLDDPFKFRKTLVNIRPTEPPINENSFAYETELLNFSEDDPKVISPIMVNYTSANETIRDLDDVQNSLSSDSESLSIADSQSFISQFNSLNDADKKNAFKKKSLPNDHWTTSFEATNLWRTTFAVDPHSLNKDFQGTESYTALNPQKAHNEATENISPTNDGILPIPEEEIKYELRALPKLTFNSTQVDGISIDFKNKDPLTENKFHRILNKLNITEEDFMNKMKELEGNPITRRLVLFLIQKCDLKMNPQTSTISMVQPTQPSNSFTDSNQKREDNRALQLLGSLYNIATKFGR